VVGCSPRLGSASGRALVPSFHQSAGLRYINRSARSAFATLAHGNAGASCGSVPLATARPACRAQATTVQRCCAALFALSFLPAAAQVVLPNYSFNATVMCRYKNPAPGAAR